MILSFFFIFLGSCSGSAYQSQKENSFDKKIIRFDTALYGYLQKKVSEDSLVAHYPVALKTFGKDILGIGAPDSVDFYSRLKQYFSEPTLMRLYTDEQQKFSDISGIENELSDALSVLFNFFPELKQPKVFMHVSGLNQSVVVTDEILSISADKYMGADYPLYKNFFYDYQLQQMTSERMVPDYVLGFLMANYSFQGNQEVLLDQMIYEGKLRYVLSQVLKDRKEPEFIGYNEDQFTWCEQNESEIWKTILEKQHLFVSDFSTTIRYMNEAPHTTTLSPNSPGRVGVWLGYRIICSYIKHHPKTSLPELFKLTDPKEILKESKYKP